MGWLIAAAVLLALGLMPISIRLAYDVSGARVSLGIGPVRIPVYPKEKSEGTISSKQQKTNAKKQSKEDKKTGDGKLSDFLPLLEKVLIFVIELRRRLVIKDLQLKIRMAGDDPSDLSIQYGRAWIALGNLIPQLERLFILKKRDIDLSCDYTSNESYVFARAVICISLGRLLWIAIFHGRHVLKQYLKIYNERKGGTDI